jgi:hypothetical protein
MSVPDTRSIEKSVTTKVSQSFNNGNKNFWASFGVKFVGSVFINME